MVWFIIGILTGGGFGWFFWWSARREALRLDEEKQMFAQEKMIMLDFMHSMVEAIGQGVDRQELFQKVVHAAVLSTGALSACVFERSNDTLRGTAVEGLFPPHRALPPSSGIKVATRAKFIEQILRSEVFRVGEGLVGTAAQTGEGILIEDARNDPRVIHHDDPALQVRSVIVVPISFRDHNIAVLAIVNPSDGGAFNEMDFSMARSLCEQAGLAIHNLDMMELQIEKNRLDVDLELASNIQGMLLPKKFPVTRILDIASVYRPAQKVGGDLYDTFRIDDDRIGFAVADVSGKGVPASIVMAICQSNLRHLAMQHASPSKVLSSLNQVLESEMREDMLVTMVYAVVDTRRGMIQMARAGHELPILFSRASGGRGAARQLPSEGMGLGMVPAEIFDTAIVETEFPFVAGDILVLFTDGITEMRNEEGTEYSNARLADLIVTLQDRSAADINQGILDSVALFVGDEPQIDDITLLTIKHV